MRLRTGLVLLLASVIWVGLSTYGLAQTVEEMEKAKKEAELRKAEAEARKAQLEAELAAFKAKIGEVPSSGYTGAVDIKDKAGSMEAALLAVKASHGAASIIAKSVAEAPGAKTSPGRTVLLYSTADLPTFAALIGIRAQQEMLKKAFTTAREASKRAEELGTFFTPPAAAAGLGLEALNKLISFFKTDFAFGGVQLQADDTLLVHAVAGQPRLQEHFTVMMPGTYNPDAVVKGGSSLLGPFANLAEDKREGQNRISDHEKKAKELAALAEKESDKGKKDEYLKKAELHRAAGETWKAAITFHDTLMNKVSTPDEKGSIPLATAIKESVVADVLQSDGLLLFVKMHTAGGSFYTKKNMWTAFGAMPFYTMGGVVASFSLFDGKSGKVLKAGVVPVHGGFVKANKVQKALEK